MSKWQERRNRIASESDFDPLISIPMLEPGNFDLSKAKRRLTFAFDSANAKNITIIDPYFLEGDIDVILELFATQPDREVTVITCLNRVKDGDKPSPGKFEAAIVLKDIVDDLERKGIFKSFEVIKARDSFHDRFFVCTDQGVDGLAISSGGSLNMLFTNYSGLIRIDNKTFKRSLLQFIAQSKANGSNLQDFIKEQK